MSFEHGLTVLRTELPDQAALHGVIDRVASLGLELADVRTIAGAPDEPLER